MFRFDRRPAAACSAAALLAALTTALSPTASAAAPAGPAQSVRVLPRLEHVSSAVDAAGGSLVVGYEAHSGPKRDGIRAFYRDPKGHWTASVRLAELGSQRVTDTAVAAGPSGYFVIAWAYATGATGNWVTAVSRSPSGTYNKKGIGFSANFPDATDADAEIRLATNDNGDAVLTQRGARWIAKSHRGFGWTRNPMPRETGEADDDNVAGLHKRDAVVTMSNDRTARLTYSFGDTPAVRQISWSPSDQNAEPAVTIDPDATDRTTNTSFGISVDGAGLQTLVVSDRYTDNTDLNVAVYRQSTVNGPFLAAFESRSQTLAYRSPAHVASRGAVTRVTWTDRFVLHTRLFDGQVWRPDVTRDGWASTNSVDRPLAIGSDGRGLEMQFGHDADAEAFCAYLDGDTVTTKSMGDNATEPPAVDVGRNSVSQVVVANDGNRGIQTLVYVRR